MHPYKQYVINFEHKQNPRKLDDVLLGRKKTTFNNLTHTLFLVFLASLNLCVMVLLVELIVPKTLLGLKSYNKKMKFTPNVYGTNLVHASNTFNKLARVAMLACLFVASRKVTPLKPLSAKLC